MISIRQLAPAAIACATACAANATPTFHLTDLGPAWETSTPNALNSQGDVVGETINGTGQIYRAGVTTPLNELSDATGVSDTGTIVGVAKSHAAEIVNGKFKDIGTLGGSYSGAQGINKNGWIVGHSVTSSNEDHAFLYSKKIMADLGTLPGGSYSRAAAISGKNVITGTANVGGNSSLIHAFRYANGLMTDLGSFVKDFNSEGTAINDKGVVTGYAALSPGAAPTFHAFVTTSKGLRDLGTLAPTIASASSVGMGINDAGHVVGWSSSAGPGFATLAFYADADGMHDLNNLLDGSTPGWVLSAATAINGSDQIIGSGTFGWSVRTFLLTPVSH